MNVPTASSPSPRTDPYVAPPDHRGARRIGGTVGAANGVGLIAAWAADEELLGHDALVQSTLKTELARGDLRTGLVESGGATLIRELNRLLRRLHYRR